MTRSAQEFADIVMSQIVGIHGGRLAISIDDALETYADQPALAEILSGLAYLHEDLTYRDTQRTEALTELERQNEELQSSRAQLAALAEELSTPIIKLWDDVLLVPLIGTFDAKRAVDMVDRLLDAVVKDGAKYVILDLTGVRVVDTGSADQFFRIIEAVRLLGTEAIIAGVQPEVALAMVSLGIDASTLTTTRNAEDALRYCRRNR